MPAPEGMGQRCLRTCCCLPAKKKLAIDPVEAEQVRLMFRLLLEGDAGTGPMGIKALVTWLNERGYRTRGGARWGKGQLHTLLTNPVYAGRQRFNYIECRTRRRKPEEERIYSDVPAIIELEAFERAQNLLKARNSRTAPARAISGPILLSGLAVCAGCGGGMTLRTGTSRSGEVYRYYTCATHARTGTPGCKGRSIRMDKLDTLVTSHLTHRLLEPERLAELLASFAGRQEDKAAAADQRITALEKEAADADERLRRLYRLVENGFAQMDAPLKERLAALQAARDNANAALARARSGSRAIFRISPLMIERFAQTMRDHLSNGDVSFRKAYVGLIVDRIEVHDREVRILGRKDLLEEAVIASSASGGVVRGCGRGWWAHKDSNLGPAD